MIIRSKLTIGTDKTMKDRIDKIMVDSGLAKSRERARALIMEGNVLVDGPPAKKAAAMINSASSITLKSEDIPYVSRRDLRLKAAIDLFNIDLNDEAAMHVGSSTGGSSCQHRHQQHNHRICHRKNDLSSC